MNHLLKRAISALFTLAALSPAANATVAEYALPDGTYRFTSTNLNGTLTPITNNTQLGYAANATANVNQLWTVKNGSDGTFSFQHALTGLYVAPNNSQNTVYTLTADEASAAHFKCNVDDKGTTDDTSDDTYAFQEINSATSNLYGFNTQPNSVKVVSWAWETGNSQFTFAAVADDELATLETAKANLYPADGIYRIVNNRSGKAAKQIFTSTYLQQAAVSDNDLQQLWKLTKTAAGTYTFQNVVSQTYVRPTEGSGAYQTVGTTADAAGTYSFNLHPNDAGNYTLISISGTGSSNGWNDFNGSYVGIYSIDAGSAWKLTKVELAENDAKLTAARSDWQENASMKEMIRTKGVFRLINRFKNQNDRALVATYENTLDEEGHIASSTLKHAMSQALTNAADTLAWGQAWVVEPAGAGYVMRNFLTGLYLNSDFGAQTAPFTWYFRPSVNGQVAGKNYYYINISKAAALSTDDGDRNYLHCGDNSNLTWWNASDGSTDKSDWGFEDVSSQITDDMVAARFDVLLNRAKPEVGTFVTFNNLGTSKLFTENYTTNATYGMTDEDALTQVWEFVEGTTAGTLRLRNAQTGRYLTTAATATAADATADFTVQLNPNFRFDHVYDIAIGGKYLRINGENSALGTNQATSRDDNFAAAWMFTAKPLTTDEVDNARTGYEENKNLLNADKDALETLLAKYFTTKLCTTLNDTYNNMSDAALDAAMTADALPPSFQKMVRKVKADNWGSRWEKPFRVYNYPIHSTTNGWDKMGFSNEYSPLYNPTGIVAEAGDLLTIMVDRDALAPNTTLYAELVKGKNNNGALTALQPGLNFVPVSSKASLFIRYNALTSTVDTMRLSHQPLMPIHIEGGTVDGCFDIDRHTDADWVALQQDGLLKHTALAVKGHKVMMYMDGAMIKKNTPEKIRELIDLWDYIVRTEQSIMGLEEYNDRFNNLLGAYNGSSYMHAGGYGSYFNEGTMGEICNYNKMVNGGGGLWGPAHEFGHNNQRIINMMGMTEVSNNLFANVVVHEYGTTTTRNSGTSIATVAQEYAAGKHWTQYNLWEQTRMYFKLYLYFHVMQNDPTFYPRLFQELRKDPMQKWGDKVTTPATLDYLKFALKCCEVSQMDLSEFFRAYGFFVPCQDLFVGDYGNNYVTATQDDIDATLEKMHSYAKRNDNIFFIEDAIKPALATYEGHAEGELRRLYEGGYYGKLGVVGEYSDFATALPLYDNLCTSTANADGTHTLTVNNGVVTEGAIGYKVTDKDGNLLFFSNQTTFTLPDTIAAMDYYVKAAMPDGRSLDVYNTAKPDTYFTVNVYGASATPRLRATDGAAGSATLPELAPNEVGFVQEANAPEGLKAVSNVVTKEGTAINLVLTNESGNYFEHDFTTAKLSFTLNNLTPATATPICLPFATAETDYATLQTISGGSLSGVTLTPASGLAAGTPAVATFDATSKTFTGTNVAIKATPAAETNIGVFKLHGAYVASDANGGALRYDAANNRFFPAADAIPAYSFYVDNTTPKHSFADYPVYYRLALATDTLLTARAFPEAQRPFGASRATDAAAHGLFSFEATDEAGVFRIKSADYGKYLTVGNATSGTFIALTDAATTDNEKWYVRSAADASYFTLEAYATRSAATPQAVNTLTSNPLADLRLYDATAAESHWRLSELTPAAATAQLAVNAARHSAAARAIDNTPRAGYFRHSDEAYATMKQTTDNADAALTALTSAVRTFVESASTRQMPASGEVYRMASITASGTKYYMYVDDSNKLRFSTDKRTDGADLFVVQTGADGKPRVAAIKGVGALSMYGSYSNAGDAVSFTGASTDTDGRLSLLILNGNNRQTWGYASNSVNNANSGMGYWTRNTSQAIYQSLQNNESTDWVFEAPTADEFNGFQAKITEGTNGRYGTLHLPFAVTLPEGVTAYAIDETGVEAPASATETGVATTRVLLTEGGVLPALTPVLLVGETGGMHSFVPAATPLNADNTLLTLDAGALRGTLTPAAPADPSLCYILARSASQVMSLFKLSSTSPTINANKAYLQLSAPVGAAGFLFEMPTTGVTAVDVESTNAPIYDLTGRRIERPAKGQLYIQNGRKLMAK